MFLLFTWVSELVASGPANVKLENLCWFACSLRTYHYDQIADVQSRKATVGQVAGGHSLECGGSAPLLVERNSTLKSCDKSQHSKRVG
jgi:hypothetical protein